MCFIFVDKPEDFQVVYNSPNCMDKANNYSSISIILGWYKV